MRKLSEAERRINDPLHPSVLKYVARVIGLYNGGAALLFGFDLVLPMSTFEHSRAYSVMAEIYPEVVWGSIFLGLGFMQVCAHHFRGSWLLRVPITLAWFYVAFLYLVGDYRAVSAVMFLWHGVWAGALFALEGARAYRRATERNGGGRGV